MQKHVNLVNLVKSFPTNIFLQNLASIQKITSPVKFAHLAEKSEKGSMSNLSTKVQRGVRSKGSQQCVVRTSAHRGFHGAAAPPRGVNAESDTVP